MDSSGDMLYQTPGKYLFGRDKNMRFSSPEITDIREQHEISAGFTTPSTKSDLMIKKSENEVAIELTELEQHEYGEVE